MSIEELVQEPRQIRAGDTVSWRVTYDDFPPDDGWTLSYKITSHESTTTITATNDNNEYVITLTSSQSAKIKPGVLDFVGYVTNASNERATVFTSKLEVLPDIAGQHPGFDNRSEARKTLELLDKAYSTFGNKAWTQSYTIADKSISFRSPREFIDFYNHIRRQVNKEDLKSGTKTNVIRYIVN